MDEEYATFKYEISVEEEDNYEGVVSGLSYVSSSAKDKEIISVTNHSTKAAEFIQGYVLFFNGGILVDEDRKYFIDDDNEIKAGKTISKEMDCYEPYDSFIVVFTGRRS